MSQKLPAVTGKELVVVLKKVGWVVTHIRGSHFQLEYPDSGERITVAVHAGKEIRPWLIKKILKQVQLSEDDFRILL